MEMTMKRMKNTSVEYHMSRINKMCSAALRTPLLGENFMLGEDIVLIYTIKDAIEEIANPNIKEAIEKYVETMFPSIHVQLDGIL